jgi:hypothetical protein
MPAAAADDMNDEQCICGRRRAWGWCFIAFDSFCVYVFNLLSLLGPQASGLDSCCGVKLFLME